MFYLLGKYFSNNPLRLLSSHLMLLAIGAVAACALVLFFLPRVWNKLPRDRGKALVAQGVESKGKPTGAGLPITLMTLAVLLLVLPLDIWIWGTVFCLVISMVFGYLDDASRSPWGELRKGLLDLLVALGAAWCIYKATGAVIWLPFTKATFVLPAVWYIPMAVLVLWISLNATNCSDGIDGLAGSLSLISLLALTVFLYGAVGYSPVAKYLLLPLYPGGAKWAILLSTVCGSLAGYLWHNANPSAVLMGDAGSRFLGLLIGVAVLAAGNPFLIIVLSFVILTNGATGMLKLLILRGCKMLGLEVRRPEAIPADTNAKEYGFIRALHKVRFPLHDHCRHNLKWSNAQVLMRFILIQAFLTPFLLILLLKVR